MISVFIRQSLTYSHYLLWSSLLCSSMLLVCFFLVYLRLLYLFFFFFFSSRRRHTRFDCDWSSDVCSSDLFTAGAGAEPRAAATTAAVRSAVPDGASRLRSWWSSMISTLGKCRAACRDRKSVV